MSRQIRGLLKKAQRFPYHDVGLKRLYGFVIASALLGLLPTACLYDSGDRCGPHQVTISNDRCACEDNYVPSTSGCVACGENEKSTNGACVCVVGYGRASPAEACEPIPAELGAECDTDGAPCPEGTAYPLCHVTDGTSGYCTNTCSSSEDCDGGYKCQEGGEENYCRRPPLGFGDDCDSDEDCAGGEATACEATQSHLCLVPCAAGDSAGCFVGDVCCGFPGDFVVCVPTEACIPSNFGTPVE